MLVFSNVAVVAYQQSNVSCCEIIFIFFRFTLKISLIGDL